MTREKEQVRTLAVLDYPQGDLARVRLLLKRRILWLRKQWQGDPLSEYKSMVISDTKANRILDGTDHRAEWEFFQIDADARRLTEEIEYLTKQLKDRDEMIHSEGVATPLQALGHMFGLSLIDQDVLMMVVAPEIDPSFGKLYAYAQDDVTRKALTPELAASILARDEVDGIEVRAAFLPQAALLRFALIEPAENHRAGDSNSVRPYRINGRVSDFLQGIDRPEERLAGLFLPPADALIVKSHLTLLNRVSKWILARAEAGSPTCINLVGLARSGRENFARGLSDGLGLGLKSIDFRRVQSLRNEPAEVLRLLQREALMYQWALLINMDSTDANDKAQMTFLDDLLSLEGTLLILVSEKRIRSHQDMLVVPISELDRNEQRDLWTEALSEDEPSGNGNIEAIVQQFDFGPRLIQQSISAARNRADMLSSDGSGTLSRELLWQTCREMTRRDLGELAQQIIPYFTWEDIVLPEDIFLQLKEITAQVAYRTQVYEDWGFGARLIRGRGINALFAGASGTGKTMAAEILANQLDLDLYRIDLAGVVSKYIGETEKNLKKVFDAAERSGAILFFDEADALFGKRTEVKDSHDRYANIEVSYLLQRMEDYRGLAILATNRKSALDSAFLRRLRFLVEFPFPDAVSRRQIWAKIFPPEAALENLDWEFLSKLEIPGGNIRNIALNTSFLAASEGVGIMMDHVMHAARREYTKIDKLMTESEFGPYLQ